MGAGGRREFVGAGKTKVSGASFEDGRGGLGWNDGLGGLRRTRTLHVKRSFAGVEAGAFAGRNRRGRGRRRVGRDGWIVDLRELELEETRTRDRFAGL